MHKSTTRLCRIPLLLAAALICVLNSCTGTEEELLSAVPASAQTVITANLVRLANEAGYTDKDGNINLSDFFNETISVSPETIDAAKEAVDLEHTVIYSLQGSSFSILCNVKDADALKALAKANSIKTSETDGYTVYDISGFKLAVKDGKIWGSENDPVAIAKLTAEKCGSDGSFTIHKGLCGFLAADRAISATISLEQTGAPQNRKYLAAAVSGNDYTASVNACLMRASGEKIPMDMLTDIHTDFMRYLPANFNIVAAAGLTDKVNWDDIAEFIGSMGGLRARGILDSVLDIIKQCDGTAAIGADGYSLPGNEPMFILMVHLPQDKIKATEQNIANEFTAYGITPYKRHDGQTELRLPGMRIFTGNTDGYMSIGTQPFVPARENSLTTIFKGQRAAVSVKLESLAGYIQGCTYGLDLSARTGATDTEIRVSFPGSDEKPLATLLGFFRIMLL